jgi:DNA-binding GntR family transcriptional regulator
LGGGRQRGDRVARTYEQLKELIVWGKLAPGSRIIETDIASRLQVSRTPVRSALQRLLQEGYILGSDNGQQLRLSVAPLTNDDARELFSITSEVEGLAARWAALRPLPERMEVVERLRGVNERLSRTIDQPSPDAHTVFDIDHAFHQAFFDAGAGPRLRALHQAVKPQAERYVRLYISALIDQVHRSVHEHEAIAAAIAAGDGLAAKEAVLTNWHNAGERLSQVIEMLGERGIW